MVHGKLFSCATARDLIVRAQQYCMCTQDLLDIFSALILHIYFTAQGEGYEGGWHRHGTQKNLRRVLLL